MQNSLVRKNIIAILIVLATFVIMFITSLLLELPLFKNPVRYIMVCLLIIIQLLLGWIVLKEFIKK